MNMRSAAAVFALAGLSIGLAQLRQGVCTQSAAKVTEVSVAAAEPVAFPPDLEQYVEEMLFRQLPVEHQRMLANIAMSRGPSVEDRQALPSGIATCFADGTDPAIVAAFNQAIPGFNPRFQQGTRWGATALNPGGTTAAGVPTTISYSFVPDGTNIPGSNGEPAAPSSLFAWMNGIYGSPATWQPLFHQIFARWGELSGITYVYQATDDGAAFPTSAGAAGVRGDVRISAHPIDGNSGVLAYNFFPQTGDMVLDANDSFYNTTTSNSLRLRNVLAHEHGHGLGMAHVCPVQQTKLMEPFVSTAYDGPRHDDIRNAHDHYGDIHEPDDVAAEATDLGAIGTSTTLGTAPAPAIVQGSTLSINAAGDADWYKFTIPSTRQVVISVTPLGQTYDDSPQDTTNCGANSGACCSGNIVDSLAGANLTLQLLGSNGSTVILTRDAAAAGQVESLGAVIPGGTYYFRVGDSGASNPPQLYTLNVQTLLPSLAITLTSTIPALQPPQTPLAVEATIEDAGGTYQPGSARLLYRLNSADPYKQVGMELVSGNLYRGIMPALPCGSAPEFYVLARTTANTLALNPADAPSVVYSYAVGAVATVANDDMETATAWTVGPNTSTAAGVWVRANPVGTIAQPEDDTTAAPGVNCWVTGNGAVGGADGAADVDGGLTTLTSPNYSTAGLGDVRVSYNRWYSNGESTSSPFADTFRVQASTDGGTTWLPAETVGPGSATDPNTNPGWIAVSWTLSEKGITPTNQLRLRFVAEDAGSASLVEAAIDDLKIVANACGPTCAPLDFNNDGNIDPLDVDAYFSILGEGPCLPALNTCNSLDFNGDGNIDPLDVDAYFSVLGEGPCL